MRQPTIHQTREKKNHRGKVKEVERLQYGLCSELKKCPSINNDFEKLLKKRGITRRLTVPYNPEQNGISERINQTLLDMERSLLIPSSFWA
jgi:hypothetical protein